MRISTSTIFDLGVYSINDQLSQLTKTQQQVATGRRILSPADDPVGAATALNIEKSLGVLNQYASNITMAQNALNIESGILSNLSRVLQDARTQIVAAGNSTLSSENLATIATTLRGYYDEILGLANSKDGQGNYLFAGFRSNTVPFTQTSGPAVYAGDQGQRTIQISASRQIAVSDSGQSVFRPGVSGADVFATLENFITALNSGTVASTDLDNALNGIDANISNLSKIQAAVGTRLNELDSALSTHSDTMLQYETTLSDVRDVDLARAISDLTRFQTNLEAAQKSFVAVLSLNLFNFIN